MTMLLRNLWNDDQGQDLIEYTLLMAFVALASAALFISSGTSVSKIWSTTNTQLSHRGHVRRELEAKRAGGAFTGALLAFECGARTTSVGADVSSRAQ